MAFDLKNLLFNDDLLCWVIYIILASFALETFGVQMVSELLNYVIYKFITVRAVLAAYGLVALYQLWYGRL